MNAVSRPLQESDLTDPAMRSAVVTGVSSGIGRALAEDLLVRGYLVFGSVRREDDAADLISQWPDSFTPLVFDVTDEAGVAAAAGKVAAALKGQQLSALVNNAGMSIAGPLMLQPMDEIRRTLDVNVVGVLLVTRAFLPLLGARAGASGRPGRVVTIGSVAGAITVPFMAAYSASKHALEAIGQGLRRELTIYGIEVATIEPSFVKSQLFGKTVSETPGDRYDGTNYEASWRAFSAGLLKQEATAADPAIVTRAVIDAIESPTPRTRYPLHAIWKIGRILPDRLFDKLIFKATGTAPFLRRRPAQ